MVEKFFLITNDSPGNSASEQYLDREGRHRLQQRLRSCAGGRRWLFQELHPDLLNGTKMDATFGQDVQLRTSLPS